MMVWDLSCSVINFHNIPLPLHRRVLQCCTPVSPHLPWSSSESQWLDSLLSPYGANVTMLQDSLYVTDCYFAPVSHRHTSLQSVTQKHWRLATRLTGDYLDQTFTGKLITACRTHDFHLRERAHGAQTKRAPQGAHIKKIGKVKLFTFPIFILRGQKKPANPVPKRHLI